MGKKRLILLRHGQSVWNHQNLFTGWVDIPLSEKGIEESIEAGKKIAHLPIDRIFTSGLIRAQMTALFALLQHESKKIPVILHQGKDRDLGKIHSEKVEKKIFPIETSSCLNERMYGDLQGKNKEEMALEYGKEAVQKWRRSYATCPPNGESLEMTVKRALPYFQETILPCFATDSTILVVAHGNSLRGIAMYLENLSSEEIVHFEIATAELLFYELEDGVWRRKKGV